MATIMVGERARSRVRAMLQDYKITIMREGYTDSSSTTWGFVVRTRKSPEVIQELVWSQVTSWCDAVPENLKSIGQY
jgi:hypothetical protein